MKIICLTSDHGNWLLRGFLHQWGKYCKLPVTIMGFTDPQIPGDDSPDQIWRPQIWDFRSIGQFADYPKERWSDGLIRALGMAKDDQVLLVLEDYWLTRQVNLHALRVAEHLLHSDPGILRFDLSSDRMYSGIEHPGVIAQGTRVELGAFGDVDVFESLAPEYRFSTQASMFNTMALLSVLVPGESPWECELNTNMRLQGRPDLRVLATYQWPFRYSIVVNKGQFDREGAWMRPARTLSAGDWAELDELGYTRKPE